MPTIYYETGRDGLIPCQFIGWKFDSISGRYEAIVKLKRKKLCYAAGELIHSLPMYIVEKAYKTKYHQYVKPAQLPARTADNTIED